MSTFQGPFGVTLIRSHVIDYTIPVYIDDLTGLVSLEIKKDQAILVRPFDWRVWMAVFTLTPAFALVLFLSDRFYDGHATWWRVVDFITRCLCIEGMVVIPRARNYNMIFSLIGIWGYYFLVLFYTGWSAIANWHAEQPAQCLSCYPLNHSKF